MTYCETNKLEKTLEFLVGYKYIEEKKKKYYPHIFEPKALGTGETRISIRDEEGNFVCNIAVITKYGCLRPTLFADMVEGLQIDENGTIKVEENF